MLESSSEQTTAAGPSQDDTEARRARERPGPDTLLDAMLLSILDAFEDPVSVTTAVRDREGRILDFRIEFANAPACRWAGLTREQIVGRIVGDILPNLRESGLFDVLTSVVDTGEPAERTGLAYEDAIPGGHRIGGVFDLQAVRLGDGYVSIWRDVAAREQTAAALARSTELLRAIVDSSPFATMAFDGDQNLVVWSAGAERLFGWRADEVIGRPPPIEMIPIADRGDAQGVRASTMPVPGSRTSLTSSISVLTSRSWTRASFGA